MTDEHPTNYYIAFQRGSELVLVDMKDNYDDALTELKKLRITLDHLSLMFPESWDDVACSFRYCSKTLRIVKVEVVYS